MTGVARGLFSNEAGLGSAPIAHSAAVTDHPVRQATYGIVGVFIDTLVICSFHSIHRPCHRRVDIRKHRCRAG